MQATLVSNQLAPSKRINIFCKFVLVAFLSINTATAHNSNPSQLVSFTADCSNYFAQIKWTTAEETKGGYFLIERTQDGTHFETIAMLKNSAIEGATTVAHEYNVVDESPLTGISYYRISEVDLADKRVYINTIVYRPCENDEAISAIMEEDKLTVALNSICSESNSCNITIIDNNNNIVMDQAYKVVSGMNCFKIDTKLPAGNYMVNVDYRNHRSFKKEYKIEEPNFK